MSWGGLTLAVGLLGLAWQLGTPWGWLIAGAMTALGVTWRRKR